MSEELPIVLVSGVSGFIGSHVCLAFLKDGGFRVRGTVRDPTNEKKIAPLKKTFGEYFDKLELVKADLNEGEAWKTAM
jgi:nucleoside-diphosphate-sugar epimerase